eukprot:TRINITY_DN5325_c0_g1_i1.p1 TRINITY_DN5325_c0_g1~~TRINITY_DN5325_c0_g1_i1.p1  ORF type:complete len:843 (-),score=298.80 TRINITY_DN5325_c0_g1_i1:512-3040(-)
MQPRYPTQDVTLGPHLVPKGSLVLVSPYLTGRNGKHFKNPDVFDPDREDLDPTSAGSNLKQIPFGYGPRQCQGQFYAENLVKACVLSIFKRFKLRVADGEPVIYSEEIGFGHPSTHVNFILSRREPLKPIKPAAPTEGLVAAVSSPSVVRSVRVSPTVSVMPAPSASAPVVSKSSKKPLKLGDRPKDGPMAGTQIFKDWVNNNGVSLSLDHSMLVLYASQSGKAQDMAERIARFAGHAQVFCHCTSIDRLQPERLAHMSIVVVVASTYGHGEAPDNGQKLESWLSLPRPADTFAGMKYAVLSLGSSVYPKPFAFGKLVQRKFRELGATELLPAGFIDEVRYADEADFTTFAHALFQSIAASAVLGKNAQKLVRKQSAYELADQAARPKFELKFAADGLALTDARPPLPAGSLRVPVLRQKLETTDPRTVVRSLEFAIPDDATFQPGDELAVYPQNAPDHVQQMLDRLGFAADVPFVLSTLPGGDEGDVPDWALEGLPHTSTLRNVLTHYVDLGDNCGTVSASLLAFLAQHTNDSDEQLELSAWSTKDNAVFMLKNLGVLAVLDAHPGIKFNPHGPKAMQTLATLLGLLRPLKPRFYSVSSSPNVTVGCMRITYKLVEFVTAQGIKHGVCSSYLSTLRQGSTAVVRLQPSQFRLPDDPTVPLVLVGAGSGVTPFMSFVEQRQHLKQQGAKVGTSLLFYGCTSEAALIDKQRWDQAVATDLLQFIPALSRQPNVAKCYVQDQLLQHGAQVWALLQQGAVVYSCGDVKVGTAIREALVEVIRIHSGTTHAAAAKTVDDMQREHRFRRSEWGLVEAPRSTIRLARFRIWAKSVVVALRFAGKLGSS